MNKTSKIFVAGHRGLVGSALIRALKSQGYSNLLTVPKTEVDLEVRDAVLKMMQKHRPKYLFLAAAKVGGIHANNKFPVEFLIKNIRIQNNIIEAAATCGVKRLVFLGSSCIYPKHCPQPMQEEHLLTGPLEPTNSAYALAKIAGIELCRAYNREYNTDFVSAMPTNLYGPGDNFDLETSHVLPALIRKFHEAVLANTPVTLWGSGEPHREFLYIDDLAEALITLANYENPPDLVNIGVGVDISISDLAILVADTTGYRGEILWDKSKPDGTSRKLLDISKIRGLGWKSNTDLKTGLQRTYKWYKQNEL